MRCDKLVTVKLLGCHLIYSNDGKLIIRQSKETNWNITCTSARTNTEAKAVDKLVVVRPQTEVADRHIMPQMWSWSCRSAYSASMWSRHWSIAVPSIITWSIAVPSIEDLDVVVRVGWCCCLCDCGRRLTEAPRSAPCDDEWLSKLGRASWT